MAQCIVLLNALLNVHAQQSLTRPTETRHAHCPGPRTNTGRPERRLQQGARPVPAITGGWTAPANSFGFIAAL